MLNTDLLLACARWALLVWQMFTSPHPSSQHVIYRKLPRPEGVSWVQFDKRRGVPHTLHPLSSWFASKLSSTMRLPATGNSQTADSFGPLPLSLNRFLARHKLFVLTLSDIFLKATIFMPGEIFRTDKSRHVASVANYAREITPLLWCYAQYRMRSAILRNHLNMVVTVSVIFLPINEQKHICSTTGTLTQKKKASVCFTNILT